MPNQEINAKVERVCYPPKTIEDATWFILKTDAGTCKGTMCWRPREGERLILSGDYAVYQGKHEFKFSSALPNIPTDSRAVLNYVCELSTGIGESMANQIWALLGEEWREIKSGDLPRFKGNVCYAFDAALESIELDLEKANILSHLINAGCSMNMAEAAYGKWHKGTIGVVTDNPYRLAELKNYGFKDVDNVIRFFYGITDRDPRRIKSAILYVMRNLTSGGSTLIKWQTLQLKCLEILQGNEDLVSKIAFQMLKEETLKGFQSEGTIALAGDYQNETTIWNYISK
jgi:hypothetical protein